MTCLHLAESHGAPHGALHGGLAAGACERVSIRGAVGDGTPAAQSPRADSHGQTMGDTFDVIMADLACGRGEAGPIQEVRYGR
jgi:hypothetical protein